MQRAKRHLMLAAATLGIAVIGGMIWSPAGAPALSCHYFSLLRLSPWRFRLKILLFSIFFSVLVATSDLATEKFTGKVVTVVDGATLDIAKPDGQIERIHLFAIAVHSLGSSRYILGIGSTLRI